MCIECTFRVLVLMAPENPLVFAGGLINGTPEVTTTAEILTPGF